MPTTALDKFLGMQNLNFKKFVLECSEHFLFNLKNRNFFQIFWVFYSKIENNDSSE